MPHLRCSGQCAGAGSSDASYRSYPISNGLWTALQLEPEPSPVQSSRDEENHRGATGGTRDGGRQAALGQAVVPIAQVQQVENRLLHFGKEIGQQDISSGE